MAVIESQLKAVGAPDKKEDFTTKAERAQQEKAEKIAAEEAKRQRKEAADIKLANEWFDYEQGKKIEDQKIKDEKELAKQIESIGKEITQAKKEQADLQDRIDREAAAKKERYTIETLSAYQRATEATVRIGEEAMNANTKQGRAWKNTAIATGMVNAAVAAGFAEEKIWSDTSDDTPWYVKLGESIAVGAEVLASELGYVNQMRSQSFASGTRYAPGGRALVGEYGPEYVNLPRGAQVYNHHETSTMSQNSGNTYHIHVNDAVTGSALSRALRAGELRSFVSDLSLYQQKYA